MFLLDTNIWLERLLGQDNSEVVGELLEALETCDICLTDFSLHSIGVICHRLQQVQVFLQFLQAVVIEGEVLVIGVPPQALSRVVEIMDQMRLDFDDAYQYVAAEQHEACIVSFDRDFDKTERGRLTPVQVLAQKP